MNKAVSRFPAIALILYFIVSQSLASERGSVPRRRTDNSRACLNYGHACWGAHGKRGENRDVILLKILHSLAQQQPAKKNTVTNRPIFGEKVSNVRIPDWGDIFEKRRQSYDEIY